MVLHFHGHRKRLKQKAKHNIRSLHDYELIELMLFFVIPRVDVKPLAKNFFLNKQGFTDIFDINFFLNNENLKSSGVYFLFKIMHATFDILMNYSKKYYKKTFEFLLNSTNSTINYLNTNCHNNIKAKFLFLNKQNYLINDDTVLTSNLDKSLKQYYKIVNIKTSKNSNIKQKFIMNNESIIKRALLYGASKIIIVNYYHFKEEEILLIKQKLIKKQKKKILHDNISIELKLIEDLNQINSDTKINKILPLDLKSTNKQDIQTKNSNELSKIDFDEKNTNFDNYNNAFDNDITEFQDYDIMSKSNNMSNEEYCEQLYQAFASNISQKTSPNIDYIDTRRLSVNSNTLTKQVNVNLAKNKNEENINLTQNNIYDKNKHILDTQYDIYCNTDNSFISKSSSKSSKNYNLANQPAIEQQNIVNINNLYVKEENLYEFIPNISTNNHFDILKVNNLYKKNAKLSQENVNVNDYNFFLSSNNANINPISLKVINIQLPSSSFLNNKIDIPKRLDKSIQSNLKTLDSLSSINNNKKHNTIKIVDQKIDTSKKIDTSDGISNLSVNKLNSFLPQNKNNNLEPQDLSLNLKQPQQLRSSTFIESIPNELEILITKIIDKLEPKISELFYTCNVTNIELLEYVLIVNDLYFISLKSRKIF